jgi:glycosyltransferase involved in cell wall biosynthesis
MRQDISAEGIPLEKMTAIPMGVAASMFTAPDLANARKILPSGVPCLLYLGTLDKVRRMDFLIRTFGLVKTAVPTARLYIVGTGVDPSDETLLKNEVARLGLNSSVVFVGQLPQPEALRYVQEADVCASPFYPTPVLRSASPTKLVEYMAMAKPVVANDHPEQRRVLDASGGGHCVPYEEHAFADAVVSLMRNPDAARLMGQRGRRYVSEHRGYGVIADEVERSLQRIIGGAR